MKVVLINALDMGSTGKIMLNIAETCRKQGIEAYTFSGTRKHSINNSSNHTVIESWWQCYAHMKIGAFTGRNELLSTMSTKRMINRIERIHPDVINLHVMHGSYLNIKVLFRYLKSLDIPIVWTFHDCWAFTGRCPHFMITNCQKWVDGCHNCIYPKNKYPVSYIDTTRKMWRLKKELFTSLGNLTIVTPSRWLASLVGKSFFRTIPVNVIPNGIDLCAFSPVVSDFREKHGIVDKKIILGVAFSWNESKGLDVFIELSKKLDSRYAIVLVGTDENVDKILPDRIISIHKTQSKRELAEIYTAADLFVNPTREDNLPTVNIEALACGTPVVTFDTGGSSEIIDSSCGISVEKNNIESLLNSIEIASDSTVYSVQNCTNRAKKYDKDSCFEDYILLFKALCQEEERKI